MKETKETKEDYIQRIMRNTVKDGYEIVMSEDGYDMYLNKETNMLLIYSKEFEDIWECSFKEFAKWQFNHYVK